MIADPADPSIYIGLILRGSDSQSAGIGASNNGLIPFTPNPLPSKYTAKIFYGNVYGQLAINIPTPAVIADVNVQGAADINVDENHDGLLKQALALGALPLSLSAAVAGNALAQDIANGGAGVKALLADFGIAASGSVGITVHDPASILTATITLSRGSGIYTGTNSPRVYFAGISTNNLLTGTFLESYVQYLQPTQTFSFDGVAAPGTLNASFTANYTFFGFTAQTTTDILSSGIGTNAFYLTAKINGSLSFLNAANVTVAGVINNHGAFALAGTSNVTIAGFTLSQANLLVNKSGIALKGTLDLPTIGTATMSAGATTNGNFVLHGTVSTNWGVTFAHQRHGEHDPLQHGPHGQHARGVPGSAGES